ncbi:MAG TPA: hypothetical protein VMZ03_10165 [Chitinophagaceae bacterium]|nr:hypothetical protein [Chitinophagaceae bacterium]
MEATIIKAGRLSSLLYLYDMHTDYYHRVLDGISDGDTHNRLDTKANHISWIAGSLVQERFELANALGKKLTSAAHEFFRDHKGIQDGLTYPSLDVYKRDWDTISPVLKEVLEETTDEQLDKPFPMPEMQMSYFDLIAFMTYREANCIGQIALWRRLLGYEAMKYM